MVRKADPLDLRHVLLRLPATQKSVRWLVFSGQSALQNTRYRRAFSAYSVEDVVMTLRHLWWRQAERDIKSRWLQSYGLPRLALIQEPFSRRGRSTSNVPYVTLVVGRSLVGRANLAQMGSRSPKDLSIQLIYSLPLLPP